MKYLIILFLSIILFNSCDNRPQGITSYEGVDNCNCVIKTFTVRGYTHEYLLYTPTVQGETSGMVHLPECKYCNNEIRKTNY